MLTDLDELTLGCRDEKAREYISESVSCYKGGAFRASIVATWIAVTYDVVDKLRELALTGDKEAEKQVERFDRIRESDDVSRALKFERDLLEMARDKFELLSPVEYQDLKRLQEDRNRCAHPTMISSEDVYRPSAELARYHLHTAVRSLLSQQPVQGKAALDRLVAECDSEYFPANSDEAVTHFKHGPLARPRRSLVRNLTIVLEKRLLLQDLDYKQRQRYAAALQGVREMHREWADEAITGTLSDIVRRLNDGELYRAVSLLTDALDLWSFLETDSRERLKRFVANMPNVYHLTWLLPIEDLQRSVEHRVKRLTESEAFDDLLFDSTRIVNDRRIELYKRSKDFETANRIGRQIQFHISELTSSQVEQLLDAIAENNQIEGSFEVKRVVRSIRDERKISVEAYNRILERHGLTQFISEDEES